MTIEQRLNELGITLPPPPKKGGVYEPCKTFAGNLAYISGCVSTIGDDVYTGKLGAEVSLEDGRKAAENCVLNILAVIHANVGLDNVKSMVKMLALVAGTDDFYQQPQVANGATELLVKIFGAEIGCPSRSAIGVNALPGNVPVEIEMLIELK